MYIAGQCAANPVSIVVAVGADRVKRLIFLAAVLWAVSINVRAVSEVPGELMDGLPSSAKELLEEVDFSEAMGLISGFGKIAESAAAYTQNVLFEQTRGAAAIFLIVVLCSLLNGMQISAKGGGSFVLSMVGTMSITILAAGSMDSLIGLGAETIRQLREFSKILLPVLASATAGTGAFTTAAFQQITVVVLVDLLLALIHGLMVPLVYLYVGILAAASCLSNGVLLGMAEGMKKMTAWILTTVLILFTLYLSIVSIVAGNVDGTAVKMAKTAISGMVPVVGGVIAEVSETILVGAGMLKNTIGIFGTLAVLAICVFPFLKLGLQYLLYKLTACCSMVVGQAELCKFIQGLGGAFGLLLGMTGSSALLLMLSVLSCIAVVLP